MKFGNHSTGFCYGLGYIKGNKTLIIQVENVQDKKRIFITFCVRRFIIMLPSVGGKGVGFSSQSQDTNGKPTHCTH